jgi:hypothetical protein
VSLRADHFDFSFSHEKRKKFIKPLDKSLQRGYNVPNVTEEVRS